VTNPYQSPADGGAAVSLARRTNRRTTLAIIACGLAGLALLLAVVAGISMALQFKHPVAVACVPLVVLCHMFSALTTLYDISQQGFRTMQFLLLGAVLIYLPVAAVLLYWVVAYDFSRSTARRLVSRGRSS
jgi:hypothetical protein